jgi:signal transduction histidine kinase/CheY-like chemotaxis protein
LRIITLLDRSIPAQMHHEPRLMARARLMQSIYLLGTVGFTTAGIARFVNTGEVMGSQVAPAVLFLAGFLVLARTQSLAVSAWVGLALALVGIVANAVEAGGLVFVLSWGIVLVNGAVYMLGWRAGVLAGAATIASAVAISHGHRLGYFPSASVSMTRDPTMAMAVVMVCVQVVIATLISMIHHHENLGLIQQLEAARAEAERSNRAKSTFLATMSHEIRTPMNGVLAASDLLRRGELSADDHELAELVHGSGVALLGLLDDILDLSKIEADKVTLESVPFDLHRTAGEALALMTPRAKQKGIEMELVIEPAVPRGVAGDPLRLRQVVLNLLGNAVKFTARGRVRLVLGAPEPGRVRVAVEDSGPGLTAEQQSRLFHAFVQADDSVHREHGGTGLGLAISRHLVDAMGGRIAIDSEVGRGSTFSFVVPLPDAVLPEPRSDGTSTAAPRPRARAPILIVDDNIVNRQVAQRMVRYLGFDSLLVDSGERALQLLESTPVSMVLMDREMPGIDGLETTRRIRAMAGTTCQTPVVGLTGAAFEADVAECLSAGMQAVLLKPVTVNAMATVVERWAHDLEPASLAL